MPSIGIKLQQLRKEGILFTGMQTKNKKEPNSEKAYRR